MPKKHHEFHVGVVIKLWTSLHITAESFEAALEKAKNMGVTDFIDIHGEHNDSSIELQSVSDYAKNLNV